MLSRIEAALGGWGHFVTRHAIWLVVLTLVATAAFATQLKHFYIETASEAFFHRLDPLRLEYDRFRQQFGRETPILVALRPRDGIFDPAFLETLRDLHDEIENEVPLLVEVTSLINARETLGVGDELNVGELLEEWPESQAGFDEIERRARANVLYRNNMISEDGTMTALVIETEAYSQTAEIDELEGFGDTEIDVAGADEGLQGLTGAEDLQIVRALDAVLARYESDSLEIYTAGAPIFTTLINVRMQEDMGVFVFLSIAIVASFLTMLFRRVGAVVLPLLTVVLTVVATISLMAATGTPLMAPTQIIPSFLLATGIGGSVHLLAIFYQARRKGQEKDEAIAHALSHSGLPIIMTSLTTAGGLISFIPAALRPISHFGAITPIGVLLGLFYTLAFLPAMISLVPMRSPVGSVDETASQRLLVRVGGFATRNAALVLCTWGLLVIVALSGVARVKMGHHMLEWFPHEEPVYEATTLLNDAFGGSNTFEVWIDSREEKGIQEPELLRKMDQIQDRITELDMLGLHSGKTISIVDVVKETHRALNENQEAYYAIPDDKNLVAQELLLFENSGTDDVEELVDTQFRTARITARVQLVDGAFYDPYLFTIRDDVREILGPDIDFEITGMTRLLANTITAALDTMLKSYSTALVVITILMVLLIGQLRLGLISMIPNLAPIVCVVGVMGWLDIPLDMFTLMIGTIAIGLAVDDTIHFMHNFKRGFDETGDVDESVRRTLRGTGQALLFTSLVLATGFLVYTQAHMTNLHWFGMLTSTAIVLAFVADVTLAPALVKIFVKPKVASEDGRSERS